MIALYDSSCPICWEQIKADVDEIKRSPDGDWCHADCADDEYPED